MNGPLSGVRVLDFSTYVAAPVCARLMADLGADVIKVEHPKGDGWRGTGKGIFAPRGCDDENPVYDLYNSGKRNISLNLKAPEGMQAFHALLAQTDVLITNIRPASLKRLGLSYEDLKEKYPRLIHATLLGYGENGPEANTAAFDTTAFWTRTGFLRDSVLDSPHYTPAVPPASMGDTVSGYLLLAEINAALYRRTQTGKGESVRSSLYHNGIFVMGTMAIRTQKPFGQKYPINRLSCGLPGGFYQCADGEWVYLPVPDPLNMDPKIFRALGKEALLEDPRYATRSARWEIKEECHTMFCQAFASQPTQYWVEKSRELDFPLERMNHYSDISVDEQAWANGYLEHVTFPNGNVDVMPVSPLEMDSVGTVHTTPARRIGEDTRTVLAELGYTPDQIEAMIAAGAAK